MRNAGPTGTVPVLQVHPSRMCHPACAHCTTASGPTAREELPLELLSSCLTDAAALGYRQLAVSGGEPLLYKPLGTLLTHARALGMITTITSNGMLASRRVWEPLAPLVDFLSISIGGTSDGHDALRQRPGAFDRTAANLHVIRESGIPFGFIFTLTQHNIEGLLPVVRFAIEQGARRVHVHPLTAQGRAPETMRDEQPDALELTAAMAEATRLSRRHGLDVHVDAVGAEQLAVYPQAFVPVRPVRRILDAAPILILDADGTVIPLTQDVYRGLHLGNVYERPLRTLANEWVAHGLADVLARACERTWLEVTADPQHAAIYWYSAVARRTQLSSVLRASCFVPGAPVPGAPCGCSVQVLGAGACAQC